ncbi:hypothetical protein HYDPIDRAFT_44753 [Hydnomerulius pinastri MD-312]|uniref:F-box domain-containing protein n=1 Tax=Hydnomerulius pinastri MD-312 TaxID=994086 RepID=A0A0C9VX22_9AGAM|nr:hypothetical protein HYDPIDRAFT_44753 [Hydnomerulius pinastri MD-312]
MEATRSSTKMSEPDSVGSGSAAPATSGVVHGGGPDSDMDVATLEDYTPNEPATKRRKRDKGEKNEAEKPAKRPRKRGRLEMMPEMNLDVLFHILGFLHPMDLLNLARTTKAFRRLLMQKSSAFVWKTSRSYIEGFPDCPPDLSEPQYANLAFYPHCHGCGHTVPTIHWRLRLRYCPGCRKEHLCDPRYPSGWGIPSYFDRVLLPLPRERIKISSRRTSYSLDRHKLNIFLEEFKKLPDDKKDDFVKEKDLQWDAIEKHATECEAWHKNMTNARKYEQETMRSARGDSLFDQLKNLGYQPEIEFYGRGRIEGFELQLFNNTKPLTVKEWDRIRPGLVERMNRHRLQRIEESVYNPRRRLLVDIYNRYVIEPAPPGTAIDLLPHVADVAHFTPFDAIIKSPEGTEVTADSFKAAFEQLPSLARAWRDDMEAQISALVVCPADVSDNETPLSEESKASNRLELAIAVFTSRANIMMFPDHLYQSLYVRPFNLHSGDLDYTEVHALGAKPWSLTTTSGSQAIKLFAPAAYVVRASGLNPRTATCADMDRRNARFLCNECPAELPNKSVLTWKGAIMHVYKRHSGWTSDQEKTRWKLIDDSRLPEIQALERPAPSPGVRCAFCQIRVGDELAGTYFLQSHLAKA